MIGMPATATTASLRRADERGHAITARGGSGQNSARPSRPTSSDACAVVLAVCVVSVLVQVTTGS